MLWNILGAAAFAALVILLCWALRGLTLLPVRAGEGTRIRLRLDISGPDPALEGAVAAIEWLRANGTLHCEIELRDLGADEATRAVMEALCRAGRVSIVNEGE